MLEWFALHPVFTVFLILVLTSGLWLGPVLVILTLAGALCFSIAVGILYVIACIWDWTGIRSRRLIRRLRRRRY